MSTDMRSSKAYFFYRKRGLGQRSASALVTHFLGWGWRWSVRGDHHRLLTPAVPAITFRQHRPIASVIRYSVVRRIRIPIVPVFGTANATAVYGAKGLPDTRGEVRAEIRSSPCFPLPAERERIVRRVLAFAADSLQAYVCSNFSLTFDYCLANFERPALGSIEAEYCK